MSRNGSGVYSLPAGSTVTNGDTSDATDLNTPLADIEADLNVARPIVAGGTGASSASAALVNLGLTATAAEINVLDGVTASTAELNILDGVTATTTELNYVDGVTSAIQTQLNAKQASGATLTSLEGLSLAEGDILYATAADTLQRLAKGTAGQALVMNSGATAPEWVTRSKTMDGPVETNVAAPFDFTIPAGTTRIRVCFDLMSLNSTGHWFIQLGTGGVATTSGYESTSNFRTTGVTTSAGFIVISNAATRVLSGILDMELSSVANNRWVSSHSMGSQDDFAVNGGGRINLAGTCDFLRLTCSAANTPDGGRVTVISE